MWALDRIVERLALASDYLYDAYIEVREWIFPFHYLSTPLWGLYVAFYYLEYYFDHFNDWVDWAAGRIDQILGYSDIWSYLEPWLSKAESAWSWVSSSYTNVGDIVDAWWSYKVNAVLIWIDEARLYADALVANVNNLLTTLKSDWDDFRGKIPGIDEVVLWWGTWREDVNMVLTNWWAGKTPEIESMIDTAFIERESFWTGWQDWGHKVTEFFSDPEEWLYKAADRIVERFW